MRVQWLPMHRIFIDIHMGIRESTVKLDMDIRVSILVRVDLIK